jgi:hypothetical protein
MAPLLTILGACAGVGSFKIDRDIPEQRVEGNAVSGALGGVFQNPIPLEVNLESETEERGTGPVDSVHLTSMKLSITPTAEPEGDSDNFDFLDRVEVFVESKKSDSELPMKKIAEVPDVPEGVRTLDFDTKTKVDLEPYIREGARITSSAQGSPPPDDVTFDGHAQFRADVL